MILRQITRALGKPLSYLGSAWLSLGSRKKAIDYIQQAYTIYQKFLETNTKIPEPPKKVLDALKNG